VRDGVPRPPAVSLRASHARHPRVTQLAPQRRPARAARQSACLVDDRRRQMLARCRELASKLRGRYLSEEYVDSQTKMRWACALDHAFEAT